MNKFCKLDENNVVIQTQRNGGSGFTLCPEYVHCGMVKDGDSFVNPTPTQEQLDFRLLEQEKAWVINELRLAHIELKKHEDNHNRTKIGTAPAWRTYRNDLRDYIQSDVINGDRPTAPT